MPNVDNHVPGSFCWIELGTTDQNAAKQFYGSLFGWAATDTPMAPEEVYTLFDLGGRKTGGCYTLRPDMRAQGIPPHWLLYISVADADRTAGEAEKAGGTVLCPPCDVMEFGRMTTIRDPTGAVFAIWQPKNHPGFGVEGEPGTVCWADLMTPDPGAASRFYSQVFGWQLESKDGSSYMHIKNGDKYIGGIPPEEHRPQNAPPHWMLYFYAPDSDAATKNAESAGARILMPPTTMEGVGRWSIVSDPQGATFALFQPGD